jgi:putative glutamine amidotransferase
MISRLAYNFDLDLFQRLIPGIELFDWNRDGNTNIDLLVFSGGEDVSLNYYLDEDHIQQYGHLCHTNPDRDEKEIKIFKAAIDGTLKVNKLYGVCRGMQLFSVLFGGTLFFDLETYGFPHPYMHEIYHKTASNLEFFKLVNSMHHQGIKTMGDNQYRLGIGARCNPKSIAIDNSGYVTEIGTWLNDRVLGVQFHPEYYDKSHPDKIKFKEFLNSWVAGETTILK